MSNAHDIAKERLARGEITTDEYKTIKNALGDELEDAPVSKITKSGESKSEGMSEREKMTAFVILIGAIVVGAFIGFQMTSYIVGGIIGALVAVGIVGTVAKYIDNS